ncbi:unnamed protein product [Plutella xylostella]|uniref:(diamondback moth) hypothetical protein n=1 Tax=Plutella xylostella TaxID=51655 RepID=A0A8S4G2T6_PLUXY|nr:unnamed protein product [Plutella xylostella]
MKKDSLKQLLVKRIGMETFSAKLSEVSKHEAYSRAAKHPQLKVKAASDILIDYEFCKLFKGLETNLARHVVTSIFSAKLSEVSRHEAYSRAAKHPQLKVKAASDILIDYEFCKLFKGLETNLARHVVTSIFSAKLSEVSRHEAYSRAAKHPQLKVKAASDILIDYEFCKLFKGLESVLIQSLTVAQTNGDTEEDTESLAQYKSLIRQQDARLHELLQQLAAEQQRGHKLQAALTDATSENSRLKDENTLLKAQLSTAASIQPAPSVDVNIQLEYQQKLSALTEEVNRLNAVSQAANEELARTKKDQDDLLELLADQDSKLNEYKMRLLSLGQPVEDDLPTEAEQSLA